MPHLPMTTGTLKPGRAPSSSSGSSSSSVSQPGSRRDPVSDSAATEREVDLPAIEANDPAFEPSAMTTTSTDVDPTKAAIAAVSLDAFYGPARIVREVSFAV